MTFVHHSGGILCVLRDERRLGRGDAQPRTSQYDCDIRCKLTGSRTCTCDEGMSEVVLTVGPRHTLREAAAAMVARNVGAAVVVDPEAPGPGVITERDILRSIGAGEDPDRELVGDHLTSNADVRRLPTGRSSGPPRRWSAEGFAIWSWSTPASSPGSSRCATSSACGRATERPATSRRPRRKPEARRTDGRRSAVCYGRRSSVVTSGRRSAADKRSVMLFGQLRDVAAGVSDPAYERDQEDHEADRSRTSS